MASSSFSLYLFLSLVYLLLCLPHNVSCGEDPMVKMHEQWMTDFNKVYETETEKESRLKIFSENVEYINEFNKAKNRTYTLAINQFTDLTNAEFVALVGRAKLHYEGSKPSVNLTDTAPPPDSVDWRDKGAVTPVKNQKTCGSCWAFAPVAAIESLVQIKTQQLISLSEQEILDCVLHAHSNCTDGYAYDSFNFVASNGGLTTEDDYLYTGTQMSCNSDKLSHKAASITTHDNVPYNDEYQLMLRVAQQPVVAAVTSAGLQHYGSGVLTGDCGTAVDHAVTLVGYGQSEYGPKYWIAKNSWGTTWGDQGYVYLAKDITTMGGTCALATNPTFPIY